MRDISLMHVDIFNRLEVFLGRFSNKMLSILKSFSGDFSRFLRSNYLFKVYNLYMSRCIYENENLLCYSSILSPSQRRDGWVMEHPPCHGRWTFHRFRRYTHARVNTDFKNMAGYHEERALKASESWGENEDKKVDQPLTNTFSKDQYTPFTSSTIPHYNNKGCNK